MQTPVTFLFRGGLNLVSPDLAIPSGTLIAALNYEADLAGYARIFAYERFDGQQAPSSASTAVDAATLRALIAAVPGTGAVNGVVVYNNAVYAIRTPSSGSAGLYVATGSGWNQVVFTCKLLNFDAGSQEWAEGEQVTGGTSGATAIIKRYVQVSGDWGAGNDATGYIVIDSITGTFQDNEALTTPSAGAAVAAGTATSLNIGGGGKYTFTIHNFFGPGKNRRLYMANGETFAYEFDAIEGWIAPIKTGVVNTADSLVVEDDGDFVVEDDADSVVISEELDKPSFIETFNNHLFIGYRDGSVVHSGVGEPLQMRTLDGAGTFSAASQVSGLLATTMSLIIGGKGSAEYLTGQDVDTFQLNPITTSSGVISYSLQRALGPTFYDDNGVRSLSATADFGDWRMGSLTRPIYPLIKAMRDRGSRVSCSMRVGAKDQYRLFFDDGTGLTVFVGIKTRRRSPFSYRSSRTSPAMGRSRKAKETATSSAARTASSTRPTRGHPSTVRRSMPTPASPSTASARRPATSASIAPSSRWSALTRSASASTTASTISAASTISPPPRSRLVLAVR
jgi:hypothetical protein